MSFIAAMVLVMGGLSLRQQRPRSGFLAANIGALVDPDAPQRRASDRLFDVNDNLRPWSGIVIHHLGENAGDPDSVDRDHRAAGLTGLGYHFLIGNGNSMGDGVIHAGYRWTQQLPGAHVAGQAGREHNHASIGICLIGNGDRRRFTDRQIEQLILLVRRLQDQLDIPSRRVHLHRDLVDGLTSPGEFFPAAFVQEQLLPSAG